MVISLLCQIAEKIRFRRLEMPSKRLGHFLPWGFRPGLFQWFLTLCRFTVSNS
jgi:hypothetical protein